MSLFNHEIEIDRKDPFLNCKLNRKKNAQILTDIINSYSNGFVLALNSKWGSGKTTFVKMWEQSLKNQNYQTVYFNAWENDFENNPLTALMGELKVLTKKSTEPQFKSVMKKAAVLSKNIAPAVVESILAKYIKTEVLKDALVGASKGITDIFENDVEDYAKKKKSISDFRSELGDFIAKTNDGKPLVFIVDELDRCRPNYAVSILEQIKHFFSVPNIVFVLSIDKIQLGNAVRGVYGSNLIDADEYLRRFIDIEYTIPKPEGETFYKYLFERYEFDDFFSSQERLKYRQLHYDKENFLSLCKLLFNSTNISLRQQQKIFINARIGLRTFGTDHFVIPMVFLYLNYIKIVQPNYYNEIKDKKLSLDSFQEKFAQSLSNKNSPDNERILMWLEGNLAHYYNNYIVEPYYRKKFYERNNETGENELLIKSKVNGENEKAFLEIHQNIYSYDMSPNRSMEYFFNRIELLEDIKS